MKIIDLFSGAGGLSEGFRQEPFDLICHIEMDPRACETLTTREAFYFFKKNGNLGPYFSYLRGKIGRDELIQLVPCNILKKIICKEISALSLPELFSMVKNQADGEKIDGIIGGPPCQAFSLIGRARNEDKKADDKRIYLYELYIAFLVEFRPTFFLFENVKGLLSFRDEKGELLFPKILDAFEQIGYVVDKQIIDSSKYGVSQKRQRLFVFGHNLPEKSKSFFGILADYVQPPITIKDLFYDLPPLFSNGSSSQSFVMSQTNSKDSFYQPDKIIPLSQHFLRPVSKNDSDIYRIVAERRQKGLSTKYSQLPPALQTHNNKTDFLDRYKCVDLNSISHTVVAHLSKDGHYYIHPDPLQNRSISIREAARIQSFPDDYFFEGSRTDAYRQIGNAVPPLLSKKLASSIVRWIK